MNEEVSYEDEYNKAWSDEEVEQPNEESEAQADEPAEDVVEEDSAEEEIVEEDKPVEESTEDKEEEQPKDDFAEVLKWNKQEIPVTREELISLAQKGFDSNKKWQDAAVDRPLKEIITKGEITAEELQMLYDVKQGNQEALATMAEKYKIDMFEAERKNYSPVVEKRNYELDDVIDEINQNEEIATQLNGYVQSSPQAVRDALVSNPQILRGLNIDMQQGIAQKVMPEVIKQLAINPNQDFVTLYQGIGRELLQKKEETKEVKSERVNPTREDKKRVAVNTKTTPPKKSVTDDYDSAWEDDNHFNAVLSRLQGY